MRQRAWLLVLVMLLALDAAAQAPEKILRLGGLFDLSSGAGMQWGVTEKNAALLAIADFERAHPGVKVAFKIEDSSYSNEKSVTALQKLASIDGLRYFIGPTWEVFSAVLPVCERRRLVCLAPSFDNAAFDNPNLKYAFTLWFDDRGYGSVHAGKINSGPYKKIAVFGSISAYYDALVEAFVERLDRKPLFIQRVGPADRDFRSLIAKVPEAVDAVAVFLLGDGQAQSFWKQWAELRREKPDFFADDGGVLYLDPAIDLKRFGYSIYYSVPDFSEGDLNQFEQAYTNAYGEKPAAFSGAVAYDSVALLLACMLRFDPDSGAVSGCLEATKNYSGLSGNISFSGSHRVSGRRMKILRY